MDEGLEARRERVGRELFGEGHVELRRSSHCLATTVLIIFAPPHFTLPTVPVE
jgi:hypothetical protein